MKIPIFYIPKTRFKKFLFVENRYKCKKEIIPIGCDCHPAYTLQKLNIRKQSLPFDWLNTSPIKGIKFVSDNIETNFINFFNNLYKNPRGHIVSEKYPYAEFIHEKDLIMNKSDRDKFIRRIKRFQELLKKETYYLYNVTSNSLESEKHVLEFYNSVLGFMAHLKNNQTLFIYIRYDENLKENDFYCNMLTKLLTKVQNVKIVNYIREKSKEGIWGNEKHYPALYKSLGIKIHLIFPKIYLK